MSFFSGKDDTFQKAIEYFNRLPKERQAFLVSSITADGAYSKEEIDIMIPFIHAIQNDISHYSQSQITNKIVELGMDETFAVLFVNNIIKEAPSVEYQIKVVAKIDDEKFKKILPAVVKAVWVDKAVKYDKLIIDLGITNEQLNCIIDLFRKGISEILRRDSSEELITNNIQKHGFSKSKADTFLNTIKINSEFWRDFLVFSNTQDAFFASNTAVEQNKEILKVMKEILELMKEKRK